MRPISIAAMIIAMLLAGCTPRITGEQVRQLQLSAGQTADDPNSPEQLNPQLWYMGSRLGYDYYHYEYDAITPRGMRHIEKSYRYLLSGDEHGGPAFARFAGYRQMPYSTDRADWVKFDPAGESRHPTSGPGSISLDELHQ